MLMSILAHRLQLLGLFDELDEFLNQADDQVFDTRIGEGILDEPGKTASCELLPSENPFLSRHTVRFLYLRLD